jgi:hypothetical protein
MASLKSSNVGVYGTFLVGNLIGLGALVLFPSMLGDVLVSAPVLAQRALSFVAPGAVACVLAFALNAFLPASLKHTLVFWRGREALPGHRAFTNLAPADSRIDMERLKDRCGGVLPTQAAEQNKLWYRLLLRHEAHPAVADAHGRFLALRDMAATTVVLAVLFSIAAAVAKADALLYPLLLGLLGIEYLILRVGAVNEAERLVCNVLAREAS